MKTPRLPDTDLARITILSAENQLAELRKFKVTYPPFNYWPFKSLLGDIFDIKTPMFQSLPETPWSTNEKKLRARANSVKTESVLTEFALES